MELAFYLTFHPLLLQLSISYRVGRRVGLYYFRVFIAQCRNWRTAYAARPSMSSKIWNIAQMSSEEIHALLEEADENFATKGESLGSEAEEIEENEDSDGNIKLGVYEIESDMD
ncbi:hypothetical protein JTB14_009047 [Gonioctena quinquepunctata]|nr:hypothetical protein JTB14_009047 [Gonioctena quinquepunctata]